MKKIVFTIVLAALFIPAAFSQTTHTIKIPLIGSEAPSFTAESTKGTITFPDDYGDTWKILFSHPQDFTPVCSSEILELAYMQKHLEKLGVKVAVVSSDDLALHKMWKASLEELNYKGRGTQKINFPLIDDHSLVISKIYGMLHQPTSTKKDIRGVFIIDPKNIVRSVNFYPIEIGRNMNEIVRIIEALQTSDQASVMTPANWNVGDDAMIDRFPLNDKDLANNPKLKDDYYNYGNFMWFKKLNKSEIIQKNE